MLEKNTKAELRGFAPPAIARHERAGPIAIMDIVEFPIRLIKAVLKYTLFTLNNRN
jgi:hypothetical protein